MSAIDRMRVAYEEHPTLRVTPSQLQRMLGCTPQETARGLDDLVAQAFLRRTGDGYFIRATPPQAVRMPQIRLAAYWLWVRSRRQWLRGQATGRRT